MTRIRNIVTAGLLATAAWVLSSGGNNPAALGCPQLEVDYSLSGPMPLTAMQYPGWRRTAGRMLQEAGNEVPDLEDRPAELYSFVCPQAGEDGPVCLLLVLGPSTDDAQPLYVVLDREGRVLVSRQGGRIFLGLRSIYHIADPQGQADHESPDGQGGAPVTAEDPFDGSRHDAIRQPGAKGGELVIGGRPCRPVPIPHSETPTDIRPDSDPDGAAVEPASTRPDGDAIQQRGDR